MDDTLKEVLSSLWNGLTMTNMFFGLFSFGISFKFGPILMVISFMCFDYNHVGVFLSFLSLGTLITANTLYILVWMK